MATGYCSTLGIMIATRAPFCSPFDCKNAARRRDISSSSAKLSDLPMQVKAGRVECLRQLATRKSPIDFSAGISISCGTTSG